MEVEGEELGSNEVEESHDKEVEKELDLEESISLGRMAEEEEMETAAAAGTAGFLIFTFIAFD